MAQRFWSEATGFMETRRGLSTPSRVPQVHDKLIFDEDAPAVLERSDKEKKII